MRLLFFHQNFPGQFRHLLRHFVAEGGHEIVFLTHKGKPSLEGVRKIEYEPHREASKTIHPYLVQFEKGLIYAQSVTRKLIELRESGFRPDVMIGNPGWGETLFVKDVFPECPLISYSEFYYRGRGSDVGFDAEFSTGFDSIVRARARAGMHLLALEAADYAYSPTRWQKAQFPTAYRDRIEVIHDGINTDVVKPNDAATFTLPNGETVTRGDEVLTYLSRNLEPYRGFHSFMRALPKILDKRPNATVVIVGGDEISYGSKPPEGGTWREKMLAETGPLPDRVHFTGRIPYSDYLNLLSVSAAPIYLTYPFVLSWSMLEAMSSGCVVIGSNTPPVREVIRDGVNGRIVDFFDTDEIATTAAEVLSDQEAQLPLRAAARETVLQRYDLKRCLSRQIALIYKAVADGPRVH